MICSAFPNQISPVHNRLNLDSKSTANSPTNRLTNRSNSSSSIRPITMVNNVIKAGDAVMLTSGASGRINALISLRALRSLWLLINAFLMILLLPFRGRRRCVIGGGVAAEENLKLTTSSSGKVVRVPAAMVPRKSVEDKEVAARRALAIKRVLEDCGDGDKETVREFSTFVTARGETIFTQSWTPVKVQVSGCSGCCIFYFGTMPYNLLK